MLTRGPMVTPATGFVTVSDMIAVSSLSTAVSSSLMSTTSTEENGEDFKLPQGNVIIHIEFGL